MAVTKVRSVTKQPEPNGKGEFVHFSGTQFWEGTSSSNCSWRVLCLKYTVNLPGVLFWSQSSSFIQYHITPGSNIPGYIQLAGFPSGRSVMIVPRGYQSPTVAVVSSPNVRANQGMRFWTPSSLYCHLLNFFTRLTLVWVLSVFKNL